MLQAQALAHIVSELKDKAPGIEIIVYTGLTWEELMLDTTPDYPWINLALECIDILVDGPYLKDDDDDTLQYRGSRNQRPIDVQATLKTGRVVVLDWDTPEIIISDGKMYAAAGVDLLGDGQPTRRCGEAA